MRYSVFDISTISSSLPDVVFQRIGPDRVISLKSRKCMFTFIVDLFMQKKTHVVLNHGTGRLISITSKVRVVFEKEPTTRRMCPHEVRVRRSPG